MKAIIHIGTEKTGTKSAQEYLFKNRPKLAENGYYFSQVAGRKNCRALVTACMTNPREDDFYAIRPVLPPTERDTFRDSLQQRIRDEIQSAPNGTHSVIFSSEHFHSRLRTQEEVARVRELLSPCFDEFKIVCYLREQSACCASSYSTTIKSGRIVSLEEFFQECTPGNHYYNYCTMLSLWENVFGLNALNISLFDPDCFLNGSLLDDFTSKIDPELVGKLRTNIPQRNKSLSRTGQLTSKFISWLFPKRIEKGGDNPLRKAIQRAISLKLTGQGVQIPPELREQIYCAFMKSNESVRKKFFSDRTVLFEPPK